MLYLCALCGFAKKFFIKNVVDPPLEGKKFPFKILTWTSRALKGQINHESTKK
jgi:hypothetical protein